MNDFIEGMSIENNFSSWLTILNQVTWRCVLYCVFFRGVKLEDTYFDRSVEKLVMGASNSRYKEKTLPSLLVANQVGNMYTSSVYGGLVSYLAT